MFKAIMKVWDSMAQYRRPWSKSCHAPQGRQAAQPHGSRAVLRSVALLRVTVEILASCSCGSAGCRAWALPAGWGDGAGTGSSIPQHCTAWCWHVFYCLMFHVHVSSFIKMSRLSRACLCSAASGIIQYIISMVAPWVDGNSVISIQSLGVCSIRCHLSSAGSERCCTLQTSEENPAPL